ncbi:MAG: uracil-DNA glycosylase family protein, partial [Bacteroidota bacterium]
GQDFANEATFLKDKGFVEPLPNKHLYRSNKNLRWLFRQQLGIDIGHPHPCSFERKQAPVFITNAIMGLKLSESMSSQVKVKWLDCYQEKYLKPLIRIIEPQVILCLGKIATYSVFSIYGYIFNSFKSVVETPPEKEKTGGIKVFPVFHTGSRMLYNRPQAASDWEKIGSYLTNLEYTNSI